MEGLFISYRREDTQGWAGHIQEGLRASFGPVPLFFDLETIAPGKEFAAVIDEALGSCGALLALIGPRWLTAVDASGRRRLDDPHDMVRLEIATALARRILVIPVLLGGAGIPGADRLPEDLAPLARRNAFDLSDKRWAYDLDGLIFALAKETGLVMCPRSAAAGTNAVVGADLVLDQVEAGDLAGVKVAGSVAAVHGPISADVGRSARIKRSKLGDIVGVKIERKDEGP